MTELDHVWSKLLIDAGRTATEFGRDEITDYIRLRATNDAIRNAGVAWLHQTVIDAAGDAMRTRNGITIDRIEPHSFASGNSTMVGSMLEVRHGVRCLSVEAGWARTPSNGIMRNGALAIARISHFGLPTETVELRLIHTETTPQWHDESSSVIDAASITMHIDKLLGG